MSTSPAPYANNHSLVFAFWLHYCQLQESSLNFSHLFQLMASETCESGMKECFEKIRYRKPVFTIQSYIQKITMTFPRIGWNGLLFLYLAWPNDLLWVSLELNSLFWMIVPQTLFSFSEYPEPFGNDIVALKKYKIITKLLNLKKREGKRRLSLTKYIFMHKICAAASTKKNLQQNNHFY